MDYSKKDLQDRFKQWENIQANAKALTATMLQARGRLEANPRILFHWDLLGDLLQGNINFCSKKYSQDPNDCWTEVPVYFHMLLNHRDNACPECITWLTSFLAFADELTYRKLNEEQKEAN